MVMVRVGAIRLYPPGVMEAPQAVSENPDTRGADRTLPSLTPEISNPHNSQQQRDLAAYSPSSEALREIAHAASAAVRRRVAGGPGVARRARPEGVRADGGKQGASRPDCQPEYLCEQQILFDAFTASRGQS